MDSQISLKTKEGYGDDFEFIGVNSVRTNTETTQPSFGYYVESHFDVSTKNKTILNIKSYNYLYVTVGLYPGNRSKPGI